MVKSKSLHYLSSVAREHMAGMLESCFPLLQILREDISSLSQVIEEMEGLPQPQQVANHLEMAHPSELGKEKPRFQKQDYLINYFLFQKGLILVWCLTFG